MKFSKRVLTGNAWRLGTDIDNNKINLSDKFNDTNVAHSLNNIIIKCNNCSGEPPNNNHMYGIV